MRANKAISQGKFEERVDLECSPYQKKKKKRWLCEVIDVLITVLTIFLCVCSSKYHVVHHKYIQFLCANETSINLEKNTTAKLKNSIEISGRLTN